MFIKSILSWGILSTSLVVCENNLIRTRSNIIGSVRFEYNLQTKLVASSFNLVDVWNWVLTIVASCTVYHHAAGSLTLNMNEVLSDPLNTQKGAMALHIVVPRFVVIVLRKIIFVVFLAFKEVRISAARFRALMWWKLLRWIMAIYVCAIMHQYEPFHVTKMPWKRCTVMRVSFLVAALIHWSSPDVQAVNSIHSFHFIYFRQHGP